MSGLDIYDEVGRRYRERIQLRQDLLKVYLTQLLKVLRALQMLEWSSNGEDRQLDRAQRTLVHPLAIEILGGRRPICRRYFRPRVHPDIYEFICFSYFGRCHVRQRNCALEVKQSPENAAT